LIRFPCSFSLQTDKVEGLMSEPEKSELGRKLRRQELEAIFGNALEEYEGFKTTPTNNVQLWKQGKGKRPNAKTAVVHTLHTRVQCPCACQKVFVIRLVNCMTEVLSCATAPGNAPAPSEWVEPANLYQIDTRGEEPRMVRSENDLALKSRIVSTRVEMVNVLHRALNGSLRF
jgi:hypothetical protein